MPAHCTITMSYFIKRFPILLFIVLLFACSRKKNIPDVSNIAISLPVQRFDQDFFALDTNNLNPGLNVLSRKYPQFFPDYISNILRLDAGDSSLPAIKAFLSYYRPVYQQSQKLFADFSTWQKQIEEGFRFTKYYFPKYPLPQKLITFIGPFDAYYNGSIGAYGDVLTQAGPAVGLQLHLGASSSVYQEGIQQGAIYEYQERRFVPDAIPVNVMKNIVDDMFPYSFDGRPLVEQMVEKGKRMYLLDQLLPHTADTLKIGYTKAQLDLCNDHEGDIWNYFVKNDLLYTTEPELTKEYLQDGPKTQELGEGVPGFLALFTGWKIVQKWMEKNDKTTLDALMQKNAQQLFNEAGYKPR